jgi:hypothetical protein
MDRALKYLSSNQNADGSFTEVGRVHHTELQVSYIALYLFSAEIFFRDLRLHTHYSIHLKKILINGYSTILILGNTYHVWALKCYFRLFDL